MKRGNKMVNLNFDKFRKTQMKHKGVYLGSDKNQQSGLNDEDYNNQSNTDNDIGATGKKI